MVHRPRYDDWSLPKGKLDAGETLAETAVREVAEETGFSCVLSRFLRQVSYPVTARGGGRADKLVDYFAARALNGSFTPNHEVDDLRWLNLDDARERLTYPHDWYVLEDFARIPTDATTVLLVRHAHAGKRSEYTGDDDTQRELSEFGREQQKALHAVLRLFGPERLYSAPRLRCEQTIAPLAGELRLDIALEPALSEENYWADPETGLHRLLRIAAKPGTAVVCSQGKVIPDLLSRVASGSGLDLGEVHSKKGSVWTLTFQHDPPPGNGTGPAVRLEAAHYLPDPMPPQGTKERRAGGADPAGI